MPSNHTVTNEIKQSPVSYSHVEQTLTPDYTGIYALCGTVFIISMITLAVINKISEKWRLSHYRIKQKEIIKTGEENKRLLKKLDKVLEVLINGTCE